MQHIFELLHKKKVKIKNGIWLSIDFICQIVFYMCVLLFTGQRFKAVCNQRKEALKERDILMLKKGTRTGSFLLLYAIKRAVTVLLHQKKVYMRKGGMKYEQIQFIYCTLNGVEKISIFFPFRILMLLKLKKQDF